MPVNLVACRTLIKNIAKLFLIIIETDKKVFTKDFLTYYFKYHILNI